MTQFIEVLLAGGILFLVYKLGEVRATGRPINVTVTQPTEYVDKVIPPQAATEEDEEPDDLNSVVQGYVNEILEGELKEKWI